MQAHDLIGWLKRKIHEGQLDIDAKIFDDPSTAQKDLSYLRAIDRYIRYQSEHERGSGRSRRLFDKLTDKSIFVVLDKNALRQFESLAFYPNTKLVTISRVEHVQKLRGVSGPVVVDHAVWEQVNNETAEALDFQLQIMSKVKYSE